MKLLHHSFKKFMLILSCQNALLQPFRLTYNNTILMNRVPLWSYYYGLIFDTQYYGLICNTQHVGLFATLGINDIHHDIKHNIT